MRTTTARHRLASSAPQLVTAAAVVLLAHFAAPPRVAAQSEPDRGRPVPALDTAGRFTIDDALDVVTYTAGDLSADGRWLAATSTTRRDNLGADFSRDGDPSYIRPALVRVWVIDTESGEARAVLPEKRNAKSLVWSPDGRQLAMLVVRGEAFEPVVWNRASGRLMRVPVPPGTYVAENSDVRWSTDGRALAFAVRKNAWREAVRDEFARLTRGPVVVQASRDPFLAWDALRRRGSQRAVVAYDVGARRLRELIPDGLIASYTLLGDNAAIAYAEDVTKKTDYDAISGGEHRLMTRALAGEAPATSRVLVPSLKNAAVVWSDDGRRYAYGREGRVWVGAVADSAPRQIAGPAAAAAGARPDTSAADTSAAERERRANERFTPVRLSADGTAIVLSNREGLWLADAATGAKTMFAVTPDSGSQAPRITVVAWSKDGNTLYLGSASRTRWERGLSRYDRRSARTTELIKDGRAYANVRLSDDARTLAMTVSEGNRPGDLYASRAQEPSALRRLTTANPQLRAKRLGKTELLSYLDVDGRTRYAVVYFPSDYVPGRRYPTVFNVYEEFFDDTFDATVNVLTAHGYVVARPSVGFDIGYPGEAWVKGVTAAANKLIELGVADSARLGVHGTSYGGYATNLLVTQTRRFKAAVNISGKVDIISFYTDSPRLGVRNVHAAEKSQDRLGATLWQQPQKYVQHSAVMFADRIATPLLLVTGEQDHNVPARNTAEMFYALRRLGKEVVWVNYVNGGHGTPGTNAEEFTDFHRRILAWYDKHLKGGAERIETAGGAR